MRSFAILFFGVIFVSVMLYARAADARYAPSSTEWDGLSDFVQLAKDEAGAQNVVAKDAIDFSALTPQDAVILLHPEGSIDVDSLSRFLREGGRVILFDDFGSGDELLRRFQIQRVALPDRPALMLRHNPALAIAEPAEHQTVSGVQRVVLNHATGVVHQELSPLLYVRDESGAKTNVALAGAVEKGHLLVVGDSSVPINGMLRFPGNKTFARNVLHYAYAGVGDVVVGHGKIYIATGAFDQSGTYGDASETSALTKLHAITDALRDFKRDGLPPSVAYFAAVMATVALGYWVWTRASRVHRPVTPRYVKAIPLAAQGGVAGHAAVIAAKGTARALAILEIKSALEEELCAALEIDRAPAPDELVKRVSDASLMGADSARSLRALLAYMGQVETLVLSRRAEAMRRVRDADVLRCSTQARAISSAMREARRTA
jgi:hypothetical protein